MQNAVLYNILVFKILVTFGLRGDDRSATAIIAKLEAFLSVQDFQTQNLRNVHVLLFFTWLKILYAFFLM